MSWCNFRDELFCKGPSDLRIYAPTTVRGLDILGKPKQLVGILRVYPSVCTSVAGSCAFILAGFLRP